MLKIKIAPNDPQSMSQDGDAILRSLQNNNMPMIDLLVRESLQNSLDATKPQSEYTEVEFKLNKFNTAEVSSYFEGISDELNKRFEKSEYVLTIKDKNTSGLTGNYLSNNTKELDKSNFHKLVFGIGKNQEKEGAGGSWGLGKTSYFRVGAGIVIYYTRIDTTNGYEERLVASLIESPKKGNQILSQSDRGIAWWGTYSDDNSERLLPITDTKLIEEILKKFEIERYKNEETGTSIIIPFIRNEYDKSLNFETELENEIKLAIQRWYAPRIYNHEYARKFNAAYLVCSVNDIEINKYNIEPTFEIFQKLYISSLIGKNINEKIITEEVKLPVSPLNNKQEPVGYVSFIEVSKEDLKINPPYNKDSALKYLNLEHIKDENHNAKVMAYCRKPGMIVEYATTSDWLPTAPIQRENHLLFAFFVPNSNEELNEKHKSMGYKDLESYLRSTENADHANWLDTDKVSIVDRIKKYSKSKIESSFISEEDKKNTTATSALSRKFGRLLPPRGYGKIGTEPTIHKKPPVERNRKVDVTLISSNPLTKDKVEIEFIIHMKKNSKCKIFLQVLAQDQRIDFIQWNKTMQDTIKFPFTFEKVILEDENEINIINNNHEFIIDHEFSQNIDIPAKAIICSYDNMYIPSIAVRINNSEVEK